MCVRRPLSAVIPAAGPCDAAKMHSLLAKAAVAFMQDPRAPLLEDPLLQPR